MHVNIALIVKFMQNYFFNPASYPRSAAATTRVNDDFLFDQGPTGASARSGSTTTDAVFDRFDLPNVPCSASRPSLQDDAGAATPDPEQSSDVDFLLASARSSRSWSTAS